jgi:hypothetical protein
MYPGEVTRIIATFNREGEYVWHCHILSHEDYEMMRPYYVGQYPGGDHMEEMTRGVAQPETTPQSTATVFSTQPLAAAVGTRDPVLLDRKPAALRPFATERASDVLGVEDGTLPADTLPGDLLA